MIDGLACAFTGQRPYYYLLEVVTVRKDNISRLVAEYLVGGFMR
jgi:hypothetical protein